MFPSVSLLFISFPELQLNTWISLHIQGKVFLLLSLFKGNCNLTDTQKPGMEQGLQDSAPLDHALGQTNLCPEGLTVITFRGDKDVKKKGIPSQVSGEEALKWRSAFRRFLGEFPQDQDLDEVTEAGAGQDGGLTVAVSAVALGNTRAEMNLHHCPALRQGFQDFLSVHGSIIIWCGCPRGSTVSLGKATLQQKAKPGKTLSCELSATNTTAAGGRRAESWRGKWGDTSQYPLPKESAIGRDSVVSFNVHYHFRYLLCSTTAKLTLKQTNISILLVTLQTVLGSAGQFFCRPAGDHSLAVFGCYGSCGGLSSSGRMRWLGLSCSLQGVWGLLLLKVASSIPGSHVILSF